MPRKYIAYSNLKGKPYTSVDDTRKYFPLQMIKPVQWHSVVTNMHMVEGCRPSIECGAMRSLSDMVKLFLEDTANVEFFSSDENDA